MNTLMIGWTTCAKEEDANNIASELIKAKLAACVHVEGPITAHYEWDGKIEADKEYKLTIKFPKSKANLIREWIEDKHPYDTPQWIAIDADDVSAKYAAWALSTTSEGFGNN